MEKSSHENTSNANMIYEEKCSNVDALLKSHNSNPHKKSDGKYGYICPARSCFESFKSARMCYRHMKEWIGFQGSFPSSINTHWQLNPQLMKAMPTICYPCREVFADSKSLTDHLRLQHSTASLCQICGKYVKIFGGFTLTRHIQMRHRKKEKTCHKKNDKTCHQKKDKTCQKKKDKTKKMCSECGKEYTNLKRHIRCKHQKSLLMCEKPFCFKLFKNEENLKSHHYQQPNCGSWFSSPTKPQESSESKNEIDGLVGATSKENPRTLLSEVETYDVVDKIKSMLSKDQQRVIDTFVMKTDNLKDDKDNFENLFSTVYYIGKLMAEVKPKQFNAEESKLYLRYNMRKFLPSVENLRPILLRKLNYEIGTRKTARRLQEKLTKAGYNGFSVSHAESGRALFKGKQNKVERCASTKLQHTINASKSTAKKHLGLAEQPSACSIPEEISSKRSRSRR